MNKIIRNRNGMNWWVLIISISLISGSCRKLVEAPIPSESIADENVYSTDATSIAVLDGMYISMGTNQQPFTGIRSIGLLAGLSADEYALFSGLSSGTHYLYYRNRLSPIGAPAGPDHWSPLYNYIFKCNAAIEGLNRSNAVTPSIKKQLLGEAKFLRAFYYFYLVNLFGDVPLVLTTDANINTSLARTSKDLVYQQIINDLEDAETFLSENYLDGLLLNTTTERTRPTKWAASALLARVYLYTKQYDKAEAEASIVINNTTLFGPLSSVSLTGVFMKNSREAIWQLQPTAAFFNTQEAQNLVLKSTGPNAGANPVYLSSTMLNSFEPGDQRAINGNWINSVTVGTKTYVFPFKYKKYLSDPSITSSSGTDNITEYFMVLRLAEQYLIRAEARAQLNNLSSAATDLNSIRTRAGLPNTTATTQQGLITAILHERQVELFSEWGHRWLDLKRTGNIDVVMNIVTPIKSNGAVTWQSYQQLYPLPTNDLIWGSNLVQNSGY